MWTWSTEGGGKRRFVEYRRAGVRACERAIGSTVALSLFFSPVLAGVAYNGTGGKRFSPLQDRRLAMTMKRGPYDHLVAEVAGHYGIDLDTVDAVVSKYLELFRAWRAEVGTGKVDGLHKGCGGLESQCELPLVQREMTLQMRLRDIVQNLRCVVLNNLDDGQVAWLCCERAKAEIVDAIRSLDGVPPCNYEGR